MTYPDHIEIRECHEIAPKFEVQNKKQIGKVHLLATTNKKSQ